MNCIESLCIGHKYASSVFLMRRSSSAGRRKGVNIPPCISEIGEWITVHVFYTIVNKRKKDEIDNIHVKIRKIIKDIEEKYSKELADPDLWINSPSKLPEIQWLALRGKTQMFSEIGSIVSSYFPELCHRVI